MKKFVAIMLVLMMAMAMVPAMAAGGFVVDGVTYGTLHDAYAAADAGDTIKMTGDVTGGGLVIDKDITIDFGGYTYTVTKPAVGSPGTKTLAFQLLSGNVTMKNGYLRINDDVEDRKTFAMLIQNYTNLTLTDMIVDGSNLDRGYFSVEEGGNGKKYSYTVSNNQGEVNVNGETSIIANTKGKDIAISADKYGTYKEPTVIIDTTGVISGKIDDTTTSEGDLIILKGHFTDESAINYYNGNLIRNEDGTLSLGFPKTVPETGDEATIILWSAMILLAGAALLVMKKKSYNY